MGQNERMPEYRQKGPWSLSVTAAVVPTIAVK